LYKINGRETADLIHKEHFQKHTARISN